jgi:hypothetical protein
MADLGRRSVLALAGLGAVGTAVSWKRLTARDIEGRNVDALNVAILGTAQNAAARSNLVAAFNRKYPEIKVRVQAMALPGLAIVGILAFNFHWNEFFRPLILTISEENFTLPLGLVTLQGNLGTGSVATVLAGVVLSMIPALVVFVIGQRPLREGLTAGTSK